MTTPFESICAAPLLLEITHWRNRDATPAVVVAKRVVSEMGYLLVALIGAVEGVARMVFASLAYLVSLLPLPNQDEIKRRIVRPLCNGIGLNFGAALLASLALFYNPASKTISLDRLRTTYLPCF